MKRNRTINGLTRLATVATVLAALPTTAWAKDVYLVAKEFQKTMPDGAVIPMWGFAEDADDNLATDGNEVPQTPGPAITTTPGETTLNVYLRNDLSVPVSLVIAGQAMPTSAVPGPTWNDGTTGPRTSLGQRVRSFGSEASPNGGTMDYHWTGTLEPGTYLYQSGTDPALQVHMGLYGALTADAAVGEGYAGISHDTEVTLLYSEIDPVLHATAAAATPTTYKPRYFLVNGEPFGPSQPPVFAGTTSDRVLVRLLNAGLKSHVPTLLGGHLGLIAEDGKVYPYMREQAAVHLAPGKTMDAIWEPTAERTYAIYDRSMHLTSAGAPVGGLLTYLDVTAGIPAPVAVDDAYSMLEDDTLSVVVPGVLANDGALLTAILVQNVGHGAVVLSADGSFTYTPNPNFSGEDAFSYKVNDGTQDSNNVATVTIAVAPVNDAPLAVDDAFEVYASETLSVAASGVLGNDSDIDGDPLTVIGYTDPTGGSLIVYGDGSFDYTPYPGTTQDTFTYTASDGALVSTATVTIAVITPVNVPPVAQDDFAEVQKNSSITINLVVNDSDPDGLIDPTTVVIVESPNRGGTVVNHFNGTVTYTPKKNFRGTTSFKYVVADNLGDVSNVATVRVNVIN